MGLTTLSTSGSGHLDYLVQKTPHKVLGWDLVHSQEPVLLACLPTVDSEWG